MIDLPHVVLIGEIQLLEVFRKLKPAILTEPPFLIRTNKKFLESEETAILIESLAGTPDNLQQFITLINARKDGLVIRIHPYSNVEKTPQVKQLLAEIAKQLLLKFPNLKVGKTNLHDFLR